MTVDRHRVAVHEAGHAVMMHLAGIPFRYITMRPRTPGARAHVYPRPGRRRRAEDWVRALLAGSVAEHICYGDDPRRVLFDGNGIDDMAEAEQLVSEVLATADHRREHTHPALPRAYVETRIDEAVELLRGYDHRIKAVADALTSRDTALTYRDFLGVIDPDPWGLSWTVEKRKSAEFYSTPPSVQNRTLGDRPRRHQKPPRNQLKGWRKPPGSAVVTRPSRFSNPYKAKPHGPYELDEALRLFRRDLLAGTLITAPGRRPTTVTDVKTLRGLDLVCACPLDQACHADILIEIANN